jgi:hypothetical protein
MKKWSIITSLVVFGALAVAAFATTGAASAGNYHPYCPSGEEGTPPYCHKHEEPPHGGEEGKKCHSGEVGTYPNCVTPALEITKVKVTSKTATITALVNAPGTLQASGKGLVTPGATTVTAGSYNLKGSLTSGKQRKLEETGKVKISVTVLYSPTGASPISKSITVVFKEEIHHRHHHHRHHHHHHPHHHHHH